MLLNVAVQRNNSFLLHPSNQVILYTFAHGYSMMSAGIASDTRLATLAFRTVQALFTTSFTTAASVAMSV
jgi:hypothetical protein